jgi:hypothetical protein
VHYGVTGLHPVRPVLEKRLSFWCTGLRPSSPRRLPWAPSVSRHTMKPRRTSSERTWQSAIKNVWYRQALRRYQQRFVHSRELHVDDLVLRWVLTQEGGNKLSPSWEGPFRVTQVCRPECVHLATEDGEPLPNP